MGWSILPARMRAILMAIIEAEGLTKTYRVFQKKEGLLGRPARPVSPRVQGSPGRRRRQLHDRAGRDGRLPRPQRRRQDDHAQDALRADLSRPAARPGCSGFVPWERADAFRRRFALVMGQKNQLWWDLPAADSFQLHREIYSLAAGRVPADPRRADRAVRRRAS